MPRLTKDKPLKLHVDKESRVTYDIDIHVVAKLIQNTINEKKINLLNLLPNGLYLSGNSNVFMTENQQAYFILSNAEFKFSEKKKAVFSDIFELKKIIQNQKYIDDCSLEYRIEAVIPIEEDFISFHSFRSKIIPLTRKDFDKLLTKNEYIKYELFNGIYIGQYLILAYIDSMITITRAYGFLVMGNCSPIDYSYDKEKHIQKFNEYLVNTDLSEKQKNDVFNIVSGVFEKNIKKYEVIMSTIISDGWNIISILSGVNSIILEFNGDYRINEWFRSKSERSRE